MRKFFCIVILCLLTFSFFGQEGVTPADYDAAIESQKVHTDFKESLFSIRFAATLPNPLSNAVLRTKFRGLYALNLSFGIRLTNSFFVGLGFRNDLLGLNRIPSPSTGFNLDTKMHLYTGYIKAGYNKFHTENIFSTLAINVGYNTSNFTKVENVKSPILNTSFSSVVLEPEYTLNFAVEENFTIGIFVSYSYMPTVFNPANIALQDVTSLTGLNQTHSTGILNVGFGFYYGIGKKFPRRDKY